MRQGAISYLGFHLPDADRSLESRDARCRRMPVSSRRPERVPRLKAAGFDRGGETVLLVRCRCLTDVAQAAPSGVAPVRSFERSQKAPSPKALRSSVMHPAQTPPSGRRVQRTGRVVRRRVKPEHPQDEVNAVDRLALLRYFASGLIAGGAGVTLTMLLAGIDIHPQSYVALGSLNVGLLAGCLYFTRSGLRWMGLPVPRTLMVAALVFLIYQLVSGVVIHPNHLVHAFSNEWWQLFGRAVIATVFGAAFRFWAEMEIDDLEFGLDHQVREPPRDRAG